MKIIKSIICCLLFFSIAASAADGKLFVEIRENVVDISSPDGESYFGSYLYALISGSSVHTDLFFTGDPEVVMSIFKDVISNHESNYFYLDSIEYLQKRGYVLAILVDAYCMNQWDDKLACLYPIKISCR